MTSAFLESCPVFFMYSVHKSRYDRYIKKIQVNVPSILIVAHQCTFFFPLNLFLIIMVGIYSPNHAGSDFFVLTLPILPEITGKKISFEICVPLEPPLRPRFDEQNPLFLRDIEVNPQSPLGIIPCRMRAAIIHLTSSDNKVNAKCHS